MNSYDNGRDDNSLRHSMQRAKNPNTTKTMKTSPVYTEYQHIFGDNGDKYSENFMHVGTSSKQNTIQKMSARKMIQDLMRGGGA